MHKNFSPNRVLPALSKLQNCSLAKLPTLWYYQRSGTLKCLCVITLEGALVREVVHWCVSKLQNCSLAKLPTLWYYQRSGTFKCLCVITLEGALVREVGGIAGYHQHRFHATYNFQVDKLLNFGSFFYILFSFFPLSLGTFFPDGQD